MIILDSPALPRLKVHEKDLALLVSYWVYEMNKVNKYSRPEQFLYTTPLFFKNQHFVWLSGSKKFQRFKRPLAGVSLVATCVWRHLCEWSTLLCLELKGIVLKKGNWENLEPYFCFRLNLFISSVVQDHVGKATAFSMVSYMVVYMHCFGERNGHPAAVQVL